MKTEFVNVSEIPVPIEFWIGCNAQDNFDMIDIASRNDYWFHVNNESSGHIIARLPRNIELNKQQINKLIIQGGVMCKKHSKHKSKKNLEIIYTKVIDVVKTHNIGKVYLRSSKIFLV